MNLCRDEVTHTLKHKIDQVFGSSFSTHGLGGVLTCGVTGVGAGLSHSPVCEVGQLEILAVVHWHHPCSSCVDLCLGTGSFRVEATCSWLL